MLAAKSLPRMRLVEKREAADNLFILKFASDLVVPLQREGGKWNFQAGQLVTIGLPDAEKPEKSVERAYSVASSPYEERIEFYVERVPGGALTPRLCALEAGQTVSCRKPAGRFTLDASITRHLQIATVTGLAPFK